MAGAVLVGGFAARSAERPNILFCIMDDASWAHMGAYGCEWVDTPAFDRLAEEGLLFRNAYTPNAKCAPSRSCILTGRNSWQLEEAANHVLDFPAKFRTFPEVLLENGYATGRTGKGWAPGNPGAINGRPRELIGRDWSELEAPPPASGMSGIDYAANFERFLDSVEDRPWFFWFGAQEPHRHYEYGSGARAGKKLSDIDRVPAFWPDNETVRNDLLDYALEIEHADAHLGRMIRMLEARGLLENTVVLMTSDNGMPFPRCKAQEYEYSNHMPLAVRWPKGIARPGRSIDDMVSFIDFAPTFLELAGIPFAASGMQPSPGRSLTDIFCSEKDGQVNPARDFVLIGKERHDYSRPNNAGYPIRGIVGKDHLYLYNYALDRWPAGNPELGYLDCDGSPTKTLILDQRRAGRETNYWDWSFGKRTVHEELYEIADDPDCMENLAAAEKAGALKREMRARMEAALKEQDDPRMAGNGAVFDTYGYSVPHGWNFYERFMQGEFTPETTGWVNPSDYEEGPLEPTDGTVVLENGSGMQVALCSYGARIMKMAVPDRNGHLADVVLGYNTVDAYKTAHKKPYFGCAVGRFAGRIAVGRFSLDGQEYRLAVNNGPNHNHGGIVGFDKVEWAAEPIPNGVRYRYESRDGEEGYPGNLRVSVTYTLTERNELVVEYRATTDKATPLNLTNHSYFNLAGEGAPTVLEHELRIHADAFLEIGETSVPTGRILPVAGTPFDFRTPKAVGRDIEGCHQQLQFGSGYDHTFVLKGDGEIVAELHDPSSGRVMQVETTEPGLQLYTANFLAGDLVGKSGKPYLRRSALCLEAQHFPDSPNQPHFPGTILRPGEEFKSRTLYRFSIRNENKEHP